MNSEEDLCRTSCHTAITTQTRIRACSGAQREAPRDVRRGFQTLNQKRNPAISGVSLIKRLKRLELSTFCMAIANFGLEFRWNKGKAYF